jgi:hypothetical protein
MHDPANPDPDPKVVDLSTLPYPTFLPDLCRELDECEVQAPFTPSELERYFLLLIRAHWSCPESFGPKLSVTLKGLAWNPDPLLRDITIEIDGSTEPKKPHMIWLAVDNFQFKKLAMGNRAQPGDDSNALENYVVACDCQLLAKHEAPSRATAKDMAWTTFSFLLGFSEGIMTTTEASEFTPQLLGAPQREEPSPQTRFRVDVGCKLSLNVAVATTVESHLLKRVNYDSQPSQP